MLKKRRMTSVTALAVCTAAALTLGAPVSAGVIQFIDEGVFVNGAIEVEAGPFFDSVSNLPVTKPLAGEPFNFSGSISATDGIGQSTGSVSQNFQIMQNGGHGGFALSGSASGQFSSLFDFDFNGEVQSSVETSIAFAVSRSAAVQLTGLVGRSSDPFSGTVDLLSAVRLYELDGKGGETLVHETATQGGMGAESLGINSLIQLDSNATYRLDVIVFAGGTFDDVIGSTHDFSSNFNIEMAVVPAPAALYLGLAGMLGLRRSRRRAA